MGDVRWSGDHERKSMRVDVRAYVRAHATHGCGRESMNTSKEAWAQVEARAHAQGRGHRSERMHVGVGVGVRVNEGVGVGAGVGACTWMWCVWSLANMSARHKKKLYARMYSHERTGSLKKLSQICTAKHSTQNKTYIRKIYIISKLRRTIYFFFNLTFEQNSILKVSNFGYFVFVEFFCYRTHKFFMSK